MTDSVRQEVVTALDTLFKTITTANSYNTNLGNNVSWWRSRPLQASELPALCLKDTNENRVVAIGQWEHLLTIEAEILVNASDDGDSMRQAAADVIKVLGTSLTLGGIAEDIRPPGSMESVDVEQDSLRMFGALMSFQVEYYTNPWDPYSP